MDNVFHLAQANIARTRAPFADPVLRGLTERIEEMNQLAERSPGFVWRLRGSEATADALQPLASYFVPFDAERLFFNMSVWEGVEALKHYTFQTRHVEMFRGKDCWIDSFDRAHLALWWVPQGHVPTIAEAAERLHAVQERGATPFAFTFRETFPKPNAL